MSMVPEIDQWLAGEIGGREGVPPALIGDASASALAIERIRFHGIALALYETSAGLGGWPAPLRDAVREDARVQTFWEESHRRTLSPLFDELARAEIRTVALKGTALAYSVYANPAWRRRGDSDLLVPEERVEDAREVLRGCGFTRQPSPHGLLFQESWWFDSGIGIEHAVDLHWRVVDSPRVETVLDSREVLRDSVPLPRLHPSARAVDTVRALMRGVVNQRLHATQGYWSEDELVMDANRLIWAMDYRLLAGALEDDGWRQLLAFASRHRLAALYSPALMQACAIAPDCVPPWVLAQLAEAPQDGKVMHYLTHPQRRSRLLSDLAASRGLRAKAGLLGRLAMPDRDHLHATFPGTGAWPIFALRLRWLVRALFRLMRAGPA